VHRGTAQNRPVGLLDLVGIVTEVIPDDDALVVRVVAALVNSGAFVSRGSFAGIPIAEPGVEVAAAKGTT